MSRYQERVFDPLRPVFVRREFKMNGRAMKPGDKFDWDKKAISARKARAIFDSGKLTHDAPDGAAPEAPIQEPVAPATETPAAAATQPEAAEDNETLPESTEELQEIARGSGRKRSTKAARAALVERGEAW